MAFDKSNQNKPFYIKLAIISYISLAVLSLHIGTVAVMPKYHDYSIIQLVEVGLTHLFEQPFTIVFSSYTLLTFGVVTFIFLFIVAWLIFDYQRHYHDKNTGGTAKWNKDIKGYNKQYTDPKGSTSNNGPYNMILSQNIFLSMNTRQTLRNNNVLVVGGSGAGKSRFLVKPNILQANTNYVITDPAGELLESTGHFLEEEGYEIKIFNLVQMAKSDQYNPFAYIRDDLGVLMMINCLIKNTNPTGSSGGDPFWEKSETALLQALVFYLIKYRPKEERNFTSVMKLLRAAEIDEQNANKKSKLDELFDQVQIKDPSSIALKQYLTFKMGAGKTLKSILISCSVRLTVFNMKQIENLTRIDTLDLGKMGEGKKALFVIIPAADSTYNFLVSMMYSQLFETLYYTAEMKKGKKLDRPVRFLLDEFANIGQIPEFTKKLATMRKYEISCTIILQNLAQIKTMYEKDWESITGNCDTFLFLGGQEYSTLEYISKELGKKTVKQKGTSMSNGKSSSSGININTSSSDLATPDALMRMPNDECIILIRGLYPFNDKKYNYPKHPNYKDTGDADDKYIYVNKKNNVEYCSMEELEVNFAKHQAAQYAKALSGEIEILSPPVQDPINSLISDIDCLKAKVIFQGPSNFVKLPDPEERYIQDEVTDAEIENEYSQKNQNVEMYDTPKINTDDFADF